MTLQDRKLIAARAELELLLRYCDEGVTIRKENIQRVLASLPTLQAAE